jgi:GH25 family lysozyme M1 (1,4-beta-N-acetylmuramidase)
MQRVIQIAQNEVGYLEKSKSAYQKNKNIIYEKTAGAGQDNYTKYGKEMHDILPSVMDFPAYWCDAFVDWCFYKAYGAKAKDVICGNFDDYTVNSCRYYEKANRLGTTPQKGAQVFFTKNGKSNGCHHTGIVYDVDNTYFYTIEGNTSNSNSVVANGGCVAKKKYSISAYKGKVLFGYPKYELVAVAQTQTRSVASSTKSIDEIAREVIAGKWGSGEDRKKRLTNAGYNYSEVQARVNQILKGDNKPTINRNLPIIDLSHHNTVSDWNKIAKSVGGVILRLGYRSYGGGVITTDKKYNEFLAQVKSHNIPYGIYFFPTSINEAEANAEADYILKMVSGLNLSFPIYLDSEIADTKTHNGRSDKLDKETRTRLLKVILDRLKAKGYDCGVYASTSWLNNQLNMSKLNGYKVWVAQYNTVCTYGGSYNMWQYSSKAQIDGVVGNCDVSKLK